MHCVEYKTRISLIVWDQRGSLRNAESSLRVCELPAGCPDELTRATESEDNHSQTH